MRGDRRKYDEHFDYISGSNQWPSNDPEDSPFNTYVCLHCGYEIYHQDYGSWPTNEPSPQDRLLARLTYHIVGCPEVHR